ncbi:MAG: mechanosensitive ion channel domain-containing protein, partial [Pseudomonadota bacterium]
MEISVVSILMERAETFVRGFVAWSPNLIAALACLLLAWIASRLVGWIAHRVSSLSKFRPSLQEALYSLSKVVIWLTGIVVAMTIALPGLSPSEVFAGAGIASLAVGLAFKDIFENYVAGLLIMLRPAMRTGDYIECEDVKGRVERITIRDTYLRDVDGVLTMVPNAFLYKNAVNVL